MQCVCVCVCVCVGVCVCVCVFSVLIGNFVDTDGSVFKRAN